MIFCGLISARESESFLCLLARSLSSGGSLDCAGLFDDRIAPTVSVYVQRGLDLGTKALLFQESWHFEWIR
jgi:hypothetical protein